MGAPTTISRVAARRDDLHGRLPVGGGVADVFLARPDDAGKARLEDGDDGGRVVDRKRRLGDVGQPLGVARLEASAQSSVVSISVAAPARQLAQGADHLGMAGMADQDDLQPLLVMRACLDMHLGDERAGGIEVEHVAGLCRGRDRLGHAMCRKNHGGAGFGDFVQLLHKNGAFRLQGLDHVTIVDDLVAYVDGCPELLQRQLDDLDGAVDTGTEATRSGHEDRERGTWALRRHG